MDILFAKYGINIIRRDGGIFISFDAGGIVVQMIEIEITEEESLKAQKSERDAYELIIKLQNEKERIRKFTDKKICRLILNA
ncbi:hypothetical protein T3H97_17880 [Paenibacillus sp. LX16]|uniref:hypothetical protein n=1 Tax=Paenibacillus sp. LX16 TaxID=1740264 RepID=UPI002E2E2D87|nr:hypothetical protein [Paenibacillus sp. LX16]